MTATGAYQYEITQFADACSREWGEFSKPDKVCVSTDVNPDLSNALTQWINAHWGISVHIISPKDTAYGVTNAYKEPLSLGSDRWAALIAVKNNIKQAAIIIDCGTVITVDAITEKGLHLGGMILPGVQLMCHSLFKGSHKIENFTINNTRLNGKDEKKMSLASLSNNTFDGINSGVLTAIVAFINCAVDQIKPSLSVSSDASAAVSENKVQIIFTGGDAETLLPFLDDSILHKPQLVLEGLAVIMDDAQ